MIPFLGCCESLPGWRFDLVYPEPCRLGYANRLAYSSAEALRRASLAQGAQNQSQAMKRQARVRTADDRKPQVVGGMAQQCVELAEAGSDKTKILSATIYLPDIADFAAMNKVWEDWVVPGQTPARATVEACQLIQDCHG